MIRRSPTNFELCYRGADSRHNHTALSWYQHSHLSENTKQRMMRVICFSLQLVILNYLLLVSVLKLQLIVLW